VAKKIQELLGWEARAVVLGHLQRAGRPIAFDRIFALRLGARAARLVIERRFGYMAALQAGEVVDVPLAAAVAERKTLTDKFLDRYESFFLPISSP
jgi:6-phosphofructokinase 1